MTGEEQAGHLEAQLEVPIGCAHQECQRAHDGRNLDSGEEPELIPKPLLSHGVTCRWTELLKVGIMLPQYVVCRAGRRIPTQSGGIGEELQHRGGVSGISGTTPMVRGLPLSSVRLGQGVAGARSVECAGCGCQTSVTAGTIFQDTRTPLPMWFRAI